MTQVNERSPRQDSAGDEPKNDLSRRNALRLLGAAVGVVGSQFVLPSNWLSPVVQVGALPAHAATSGDAAADADADAGPADAGEPACTCKLQWDIDNLSPCVEDPTDTTIATVYSSHLDADSFPTCDPWQGSFPHVTPTTAWSKQRLQGDCTGKAELCITLKQGKYADPKDTDCVMTTYCEKVDYKTAGKSLEMSDIPGWAVQDEACSTGFYEEGGYIELTAKDSTLGCKQGPEVLLSRIEMCPVQCNLNPSLPICKKCKGGTGSTSF